MIKWATTCELSRGRREVHTSYAPLAKLSTKWWKGLVRGVIIGKWKKGRNGAFSPNKSTGNIKENTNVMTCSITSRKKQIKPIKISFAKSLKHLVWNMFSNCFNAFFFQNNSIHKELSGIHVEDCTAVAQQKTSDNTFSVYVLVELCVSNITELIYLGQQYP